MIDESGLAVPEPLGRLRIPPSEPHDHAGQRRARLSTAPRTTTAAEVRAEVALEWAGYGSLLVLLPVKRARNGSRRTGQVGCSVVSSSSLGPPAPATT